MKIHCIGIGGIGVSALAQYYLYEGHEVSGSDLAQSEITDFLKKKGIKILIGQKAENIAPDIGRVIFSPAVPQNNPEYAKAKELGLKLQSYPEALGELTKKYTTIAISGSHGKSTTTAMIGLLLMKAGLDPTIIVGTRLRDLDNSNFRAGRGTYLVIEACEYDDSFLNYQPEVVVVTNVDKEHLDYFKTFKNVIAEFRKFIMKLPESGILVFNQDDKKIPRIKKAVFKCMGYSLKQMEAAILQKSLQIPGKHNISNALAALTVARALGIKDEISFESLAEYQGSWRRFEIIKSEPYTVISDYGHHPNEVSVTLQATREKYANKKIWCIFQPHQYQRTHYLFKDFTTIFRKVPIDQIIITDIYDVAGREEKNISSSVNAQKLVQEIDRKNVSYMPLPSAETFVRKNIKNGEVLIIMGAGDVYKVAERFK